MMNRTVGCWGQACVLLIVITGYARADEGMWLFNNPPTKLLKDKNNFEPSASWLEHVQKSCVKFGFGGSSSIVSPHGLVMTNHHVGRGQLQKLSTPERDLLKDGFLARSYDEELPCSDLEVNRLWSIEDVTAYVNSAVTDSMSSADANKARKKRIAEITKEAESTTGLNCDVVTLYHGARYHLYSYKRYTDIRLVMAPDGTIAHFGGDVDNFEYPRYCLDMSFFRIYENSKPLHTEHYLSWSRNGSQEGDLVFVIGHPGRTQRLYTVDHLKFLRDVQYPSLLNLMWRREVQLKTFSERNAENARIAQSELMGVQNSRKAFTGMLAGLHDPDIFREKIKAEHAIRAAINENSEHQKQWGDSWDKISTSLNTFREFNTRYSALEGRASGGRSKLFSIALHLVRLAEELPKPNGDRFQEYRDSSLDTLYLRLYSPAPIYDELEINRLSSAFSYLAETFGGDDPLVTKVLAGKSPIDRAVELVKGTKLKDIDERRRLAEGGAVAIAASNDPMIRLLYDIDPEARAVRKRYEDDVQSVQREAYANIGAARFAAYGENMYPDATGSLRMTFGEVKKFNEAGQEIAPYTNFNGLYARHKERGHEKAFELSRRWLDGKDKIDLNTPFNFVSTTDVIGGNSGSPIINRRGEVVGLVFDINIHALVWSTAYTDRVARTVGVDSRAIIESLRKIYGANKLADEIVGK